MSDLQTTTEGSALLVEITRPKQANALSTDLLQELEAAMDAAEADRGIRAVVLTGSSSVFSAGADLREAVASFDVMDALRYVRLLQRATTTIESMLKPVVAAIRGHCMTGGLELVLACDRRVAGTSAHFAITSSRIGSVAGMGGTQRLPRVVGAAAAKDILYTGRDVAADEALAIGLVDELHADEDVISVAFEWAGTVADRAPLSVSLTKMAVNTGVDLDLASALSVELGLAVLAAGTADRAEGIQAFLEKRPPSFSGS